MTFKFCPSCGNEIVDGQKFCTKCGYNLLKDQQDYSEEAETTQRQEEEPIQQPETEPQSKPGPVAESQSQPGQEAGKKEPSINVNVPAPASLTTNEPNFLRDYDKNRIIQYKNLMGINTGVQNTIWVKKVPGMFNDSSFPEINTSWFILSFEDEGLVLIGLDNKGFFNEQNALLPNDRIKTVKVHKGFGKKNIIFTTFNGDSIQFYSIFAFLGSTHQLQNYNNLENLVRKYNK